MRKFENKHLKREKEYRSLLEHLYALYKLDRTSDTQSEITKTRRKLRTKFFNEFCGPYQTAPHFYRRYKNRIQRNIAKKDIFNYMKDPEFEMVFEDNYKDCAWYW